MALQVPERHDDGGDQPAIEHAAGAHQVQELRRVRPELVELDNE